MDIRYLQTALIVLGVLGSAFALYRNRIVWSKIVVGLTLTLVATLQLGVTPLEKKVRRLRSRLALMAPDDPFRPKAEKDLEGALLTLDPVQAWEWKVEKLEARLDELRKEQAPAGELAAVKQELATARSNLEQARDPAAWCRQRKADLELQMRKLEAAGTSKDDPAYVKARKELERVRELERHPRRRKRSWQERLPVNRGLDLAGGTEIRLRLKPDLTRLHGWQEELKQTRKRLADLQAQGPAAPAEEVRKLQAAQEDTEKKIAASQRSLTEEFDKAVDIIRSRLNASGLAEIPVMRQGTDEVLIQLPGMDSGRAQQVIETVQRQGKLEFRVVISEQDNKEAYEKIRSYLEAHPELKGKELHRFCLDDERPLKPAEIEIEHDGDDGERWLCKAHRSVLVDYLRTPDKTKGGKVIQRGQWLIVPREVLIKGEHIIRARAAPNSMQPGRFRIAITLDTIGGTLMESVTGQYLHKRMALVLDGKLKSAPTIQGRFSYNFEITGDFDQSEAEQLEVVLRSGSLKVVPQVEFESTVGPTLGEDSIRRGIQAMFVGVALVFVFMLVYYLLAGAVTDTILVVNLILIVAILSSFDATLTLPGIAGIILTVGMAVDANVLIFERIREERARGNSLARSVQLGYERAFVTIVDANVTTLITGVILHSFGTEAVRGFAVTLIIGILTSMFCSLVLTRWIFDLILEYKLVDDLKMLLMFKRPSFNFIGVRRYAMAGSLLLILGGMAVIAYRQYDGGRNLGADFTGGTIAQVALSKPLSMAEARQRVRSLPAFAEAAESMQSFGTPVDGKFSEFVLRLKPGTGRRKSKLTDQDSKRIADQFKRDLRKVFPSLQPEGVVMGARQADRCTPTTDFYTVNLTLRQPASPRYVQQLLADQGALVDPMVIKTGDPLPRVPSSDRAEVTLFLAYEAVRGFLPKPKAPAPEKGKNQPNTKTQSRPASKPKPKPGAGDRPPADGQPAKAATERGDRAAREIKACRLVLKAALAAAKQDLLAPEGMGEVVKDAAGRAPAGTLRVKVALTCKRPVSAWELKQVFRQELPGISGVAAIKLVAPSAPDFTPADTPASRLTLICGVPLNAEGGTPRELAASSTQFIRDQLQKLRKTGALDFTSPFPRFISVGPTVAGQMGTNALMAMLYAMVAIFFYIWLRFQFRAAFGLGAVVALVHDVLISVGALAVADELGLLNGQIDLTIVAALLTIVGYSLNDTIVVFDRIRENLHGGGRALEEVINVAINQTLSRTVITSFTTVMVVLALLVWGGDVIRGFAFSLFIGIMVGTYSSIFIASPVLVEFARMYDKYQQRKREKRMQATS